MTRLSSDVSSPPQARDARNLDVEYAEVGVDPSVQEVDVGQLYVEVRQLDVGQVDVRQVNVGQIHVREIDRRELWEGRRLRDQVQDVLEEALSLNGGAILEQATSGGIGSGF